MSQAKPCIFVNGRACPFKVEKVPFQTCQLCIEAWKTEVAIKNKRRAQQAQSLPAQAQNGAQPLSINVTGLEESVHFNEGLKEIDELLKNETIDPMEYVRLRKQQLDNLTREAIGRKSTVKLDQLEKPVNDIKPVPRRIRVAVVVKTMLGKQVKTSPDGWKLPKTINDKVINSIFKLTGQKKAEDIKLRAGEFKIACVRHEGGKFAIMVFDADEEFETYHHEIERVSEILAKEKLWATAVKKVHA